MASLKTLTADLDKAMASDKRKILSESLTKYFYGSDIYVHLEDYDDNYVYFSFYLKGSYHLFKVEYTFSNLKATFEDEVSPVVKTTVYEEIQEESTIEKSVPSKSECGTIYKEFQNNMQVVECLYIGIYEADGVGDYYASPEVCEAMVDSFNKAISDGRMTGNYFHKLDTDDFSPVKAWMNPIDCYIGDTFVPEGQPLVLNQFHDETAYELRKSGEFKGVSIGARATWEVED